MLKQIKNESTKRSDLIAFVKEAERMIAVYGWEDLNVYPYSYPVKLTKVIADLKDYDRCTSGSKAYLILLANVLAPILNAWEEHANDPKVSIKILSSGKIAVVDEDIGMELVKEGHAVLA